MPDAAPVMTAIFPLRRSDTVVPHLLKWHQLRAPRCNRRLARPSRDQYDEQSDDCRWCRAENNCRGVPRPMNSEAAALSAPPWPRCTSRSSNSSGHQAGSAGLRPLSGPQPGGLKVRSGSGVPVRGRRELPFICDRRVGDQCHRHERRRMAGSKSLPTYVAGTFQRQLSTVAVAHPSRHRPSAVSLKRALGPRD
jgi:hypothetical protein